MEIMQHQQQYQHQMQMQTQQEQQQQMQMQMQMQYQMHNNGFSNGNPNGNPYNMPPLSNQPPPHDQLIGGLPPLPQHAPMPASFNPSKYWWMPEDPEEQVKECFLAYERFQYLTEHQVMWPKVAFHFRYFGGNLVKDAPNCESHCVVFYITNAIRRCFMAKPKNNPEKNVPFLAGMGRGRSRYHSDILGKCQIKFENVKVTSSSVKEGQRYWMNGRSEKCEKMDEEKQQIHMYFRLTAQSPDDRRVYTFAEFDALNVRQDTREGAYTRTFFHIILIKIFSVICFRI
jgi:hypothetical protein